MADLGTLALGDYTNVSNTAITGTNPVLEVIGSADDADFVADTSNSDHTGECWFAIATTLPADLDNVDTLSINLRYGLSTTKGTNDWLFLQARVFKSDGTTALTDLLTVVDGGTGISNTTPANSGAVAFAGVDTAATKAEWQAAQVRIYFVINRDGGGDSVAEHVYAAELTGTYTAAAPNEYSLPGGAEAGSYSITGTTAVLEVEINVDVGDYDITGTAATLIHGYPIVAGSGSYTLYGEPQQFRYFHLNVDSGTYSIVGAESFRAYVLVHDSGSYTLTGTDATLTQATPGETLAVDPGSYTLTGTATTLEADRLLVVDAGSYTYTGTAVTFLYGQVLPIDSGVYALSGQDVTLIDSGATVDTPPLLACMGYGR